MAAIAERIEPVVVEEEIQSSFIDYAMSVIVSRALPDVRDGLKPVHRRIPFSMQESGLLPEDRKSTRLNSSHGYISYAVFCLKKKNYSNMPPHSLAFRTSHRHARTTPHPVTHLRTALTTRHISSTVDIGVSTPTTRPSLLKAV